MLKTTVGQLLVDQALPEDMRGRSGVLDKKGLAKLLEEVATRHPEKYREVSHALATVGHTVAQATGGNSFGLAHLRPAASAQAMRLELEKKIDKIYGDPNLSNESKETQVVEHLLNASKPMEDAIYKESIAEGNPLAQQILSGARGSPMNLKSLRGSDLLYVDHHEKPIPIPILRNYSEGLSPVEYYSGTFGARNGVISAKFATSDAGYFSKRLVQAGHRLIVTKHDSDEEPTDHRGLPTTPDDSDNEGALLAAPAGGYPRNTILTPKILSTLKTSGVQRMLVRSPITGGPADGGVYAKDLGIREKGTLPPVGDFCGISAGHALAEPLTQSGLSAKHSGGVAGANKGASGFKLINQLVEVPHTFKGGAAHAQVDGRVQSVEEAPQGGTYVTVEGHKHYVSPGFEVFAKRGDNVEAGDVLSEGIPNPAEIVKHKGIGEGRRYFVDAFRNAYKDSGITSHRRNIELMARGLIDHVRMTEEHDEHLPDDVVPYSRLENGWQPRQGFDITSPKRAAGMYLEQPVLHYSIGTKIRPSVVKKLEEFGVQNVAAHNDPPPFEPEMIRSMDNLSHDPDWMTRFLGSHLQKNLLKGVHRGDVSDSMGTSYVPALASGEHFGTLGATKGWKSPPG